MLRFGSSFIGGGLGLLGLLMLVVGLQKAWEESSPGTVLVAVGTAASLWSVATFVAGVGASLRRLEERIEEVVRTREV